MGRSVQGRSCLPKHQATPAAELGSRPSRKYLLLRASRVEKARRGSGGCTGSVEPREPAYALTRANDDVLVFDGDAAGRKAAYRSAETAILAGVEPRIVRLPEGQDPADLVAAGEGDTILAALQEAPGLVECMFREVDERGGERDEILFGGIVINIDVPGLEDLPIPLRINDLIFAERILRVSGFDPEQSGKRSCGGQSMYRGSPGHSRPP